jgi:uncharacterized RDD family membrane protein YckC
MSDPWSAPPPPPEGSAEYGQAGPRQFTPDGLVAPETLNLASPGLRLGQYLLEIVLFIVTLGIGYIVWALVAWSSGRTPGMICLGIHVVDAQTARRSTWGQMFVRQFLVQGLLIGVVGEFTFGILFLVAALMIFTEGYRTLWDRIAKTYVVHNAL